MTKHFAEEECSFVLSEKRYTLKYILVQEWKAITPFILTTKLKEFFIREIGLEGLKQYVRNYGFDSIYIIDEFDYPIKEEIIL